MLTPLMGYIYGKYTITKDSELRNLLVFFLVLSIYYFMMSIAQKFALEEIIWPKTILDQSKGLWHKGRSRGPVLHPPMFGQLIAMLLMVNVYFLVKARSVFVKAFLWLCFAGSAIGSLFTYTRGPWVTILAGFGFLFFWSHRYRKTLLVIVIVGVLGGSLGLIQMANSDFLQERLANTNTIENRLGFLATTLRMMRDHPLGIGYFRWQDYVGEYNQTTMIPFYGMVRKNISADVPIHDIYLGRIAEEGLVGAILQWAFYIVIFKAFMRRMRSRCLDQSGFDLDTLILIGAIMFTYLVGGMVIDYRFFDLINVIFFIFWQASFTASIRERKVSLGLK